MLNRVKPTLARLTATSLLFFGVVHIELLGPSLAHPQKVRMLAVYDAPIEKVWNAFTDFDHFADFVPRVKKCQTTDLPAGTKKVHIEVHLPWPLEDAWNDLAVTLAEDHRKISWIDMGGTLKDNEGVVLFSQKGTQTQVSIELVVIPHGPVPGLVVRSLVKRYLPTALRAIDLRLMSANPAKINPSPSH